MFESFFGNSPSNYYERLVDNYTIPEVLVVDTTRVNDGKQPYETAVEHTDYNNCKFVIVEAYDTREEAQKGHDKWVKIMTTEPLPEFLQDCLNSIPVDLMRIVGGIDSEEVGLLKHYRHGRQKG